MSVGQLVSRKNGSDARAPAQRIRIKDSWRWITWICLGWLGLVVLAGIFGPMIWTVSPFSLDLLNVYSGLSLAHPLGTDDTGRDILARVLAGIPPTLTGPVLVVVLSGTVGALLGVVAGWFGGFVDTLISRFFDMVFSFPGLIVAILASALFGAGFWAPVIALSIGYIPILGRIVRVETIRERNLPYIAALEVQGQSRTVIWLRHLLPNLAPIFVVQSAIGFSYAMLDLAAISYLGLGPQPPATDWGLLVSTGQSGILSGHPGQSLIAALLVVATVVSANMLSDRLAQKFEMGDR